MSRTKRIFAVAVVAACLSLIGAGTLAYFTAEETAHNVITSGNVDIELVEKQVVDGKQVDFPKTGVFDVMPNTDVSKVVWVENIGQGNAFVRARVSASIELADGGEGDASFLSMDFPQQTEGAAWVERDGWWYYMAVDESGVPGLLPSGVDGAEGSATTPLFTRVFFSKDMPNKYQGSQATVLVEVEAVQSDNNGDSALEAAGWPTGLSEAA